MALKPTPKTSPGRRPIIPLPANVDNSIRRAFDAVAHFLSLSDTETTTIIKRTLVTLGVARETNSGGIVAGDGVVPIMKVPPMPTGLVTTPGFRSVSLRCDTYYPFYLNHGIMEVWRSLVNDRSTAVAVNSASGFMVTDVPLETTPGTVFYYWIRFISAAGVVGPFNSEEGTAGQTSVDAGYVLSLLEGEILDSHLAESLSERIDLIDGDGGLVEIAVDQGVAIDGLSGQYTAKIDNNGFVTGFGLASTAANGAALSEFYALVDRFAIINPAVAPKTITITRVDATATAASTAHGFAVGDYVVIVGAAQPEYNGTQKILTVPDADSFTFAVSGSPASPATIDTANGYAAIKAAGAKVPFIVQDGVVYINVAMIGELSADVITSGTVTGRTVQTANSGKRTAIYASDYSDPALAGEIHVWDDLGGGLEEIASVGKNTVDADQTIGMFGTATVTAAYIRGVIGRSYRTVGLHGISTLLYGVYGQGAYGVRGDSGTSYPSGIGVYGSATGATSYGVLGAGGAWDFYAAGDTEGYNVFGPGSYGPFTGAHDGLVPNGFPPIVGDILVDTAVFNHKNISNTLTLMEYSSSAKQKNVVGVLVSIRELDPDGAGTALPYPWPVDYSLLYDTVIVNAVGEGQINVCKEGGNIEAGDYICSSSRPGKGMKQDDDLLHNYTVAKAREDCVWLEGENDIRMIACTYHCG